MKNKKSNDKHHQVQNQQDLPHTKPSNDRIFLRIDCSDQPLDMSFHPTKSLVVAALVDGTVELHDYSLLSNSPLGGEEDEEDTILASLDVHTRDQVRSRPMGERQKNDCDAEEAFHPAIISSTYPSCRAVLFSTQNGHNLFSAGNSGSLACLDTSRCMNTSTREGEDDAVIWKIDDASSSNPIHVLYQPTFTLRNPNCNYDDTTTATSLSCTHDPTSILFTGDEEGIIRLWDIRTCQSSHANTTATMASVPCRSDLRSKGCVMSWMHHTDYISGLACTSDGNVLLSSSADGTLSVIDIRYSSNTMSFSPEDDINNQDMKIGKTHGRDHSKNKKKSNQSAKTNRHVHKIPPLQGHGPLAYQSTSSNNNNALSHKNNNHDLSKKILQCNMVPPYSLIRQSESQDDELLSLLFMKNEKKVVCGTQRGVLHIWSYGTWGDVSDRVLGHPPHHSIDALLMLDQDTLLTGCSDGYIRVLQVQPNQFLGILNSQDEDAHHFFDKKEERHLMHDPKKIKMDPDSLAQRGRFPIEKLEFTWERNYVASLSHDNFIRLYKFDEDDDDDSTNDDHSSLDSKHESQALDKICNNKSKEKKDVSSSSSMMKKQGSMQQDSKSKKTISNDSDDEWDEDESDDDGSENSNSSDDDNDSSDDDDDSEVNTKRPKRMTFLTENEKFFQDL